MPRRTRCLFIWKRRTFDKSECESIVLGSAGSLPAVVGSLPTTFLFGKLPKSTGWQPVLRGSALRAAKRLQLHGHAYEWAAAQRETPGQICRTCDADAPVRDGIGGQIRVVN